MEQSRSGEFRTPDPMIRDPRRLLEPPANLARLSGALFDERELLEQLLFKSTELSLLVADGRLDLLVAAADEVIELGEHLGEAALVRAAIAHALSPDGAGSIEAALRDAPSGPATAIGMLRDDVARLADELEEVRRTTLGLLQEKEAQIRRELTEAEAARLPMGLTAPPGDV